MSLLDVAHAPPLVRDWLHNTAPIVDAALGRVVTHDGDDPGRLWQAMRYAVLGGGKRLRPALVLGVARALGGTEGDALPAAVAIELLHAYTLVHDDLPAMDDDAIRRGKPTVHIEFGEAIAILTGDALLTLAFAQLAELPRGSAAATRVLAARAGANELLRGQALDLASDHQAADLTAIETLAAAKTGALFAAACELGAIAAGANAADVTRAGAYGLAVGIAFQHADDADDGEFLTLRSAADARRAELCASAAVHVASWPHADPLREFAAWLGR